MSVTFLLLGSVTHSQIVQGASRLQVEEAAYLYLPLVMKEFQWQGAWIAGKVVDARDQDQNLQPDPLAGAQVCTQYSECTTTDANGDYQISLGDTAWRQVTASKEGFLSLTQAVYPLANRTVTLNFVLSQPLTDVVSRIVLTWDTTKRFTAPVPEGFVNNDLDAYLFMEHQTSNQVIYYDFRGNCTDFPNACLLYDVQEGGGPETIDIATLEEGDPPTVYHYAVHHANYFYSQKTMPSLAELQARVCLYFQGTNQANCYLAPEGELQLWYVFSMDQEGNVTLRNCLSDDPVDISGTTPPACP
ncbi:MAG: hypothetical protein Kow0088_24600 [Anaerolineales bacterium]